MCRLVAVVVQQVGEDQEAGGPALGAERGPRRLGPSCRPDGLVDVLRAPEPDRRLYRSGGRIPVVVGASRGSAPPGAADQVTLDGQAFHDGRYRGGSHGTT